MGKYVLKKMYTFIAMYILFETLCNLCKLKVSSINAESAWPEFLLLGIVKTLFCIMSVVLTEVL